LAIAQRFGDHVVVALEETRRRAAQREASRLHAQLEASLLPNLRPRDPELRLLARYRPGEHRMLLGGDFLDAAEVDDGRLFLVIGDVSGHGPSEAALGATLRAAWRTLVLTGASLSQVVDGLDRVLVDERASHETFATVCCVEVARDRRTLRVA